MSDFDLQRLSLGPAVEPNGAPHRGSTGRAKLPLHWKIAIGFVTGLLLGVLVHYVIGADATWVQSLMKYVTQPFATVFLKLIFMLIVPLLFSALVVGVSEMEDIRALGRLGWRTLGYTIVLSGIAAVLGLVLVNVFKPGAGVDPTLAKDLLAQSSGHIQAIGPGSASQSNVLDMLMRIVPDNVIDAASKNASILSLMFFALMFGVGLVMSKASPATEALKRGIAGLYEVSMTLIDLVIRLAPYAVFCFMFNLSVLFGWDLLIKLGSYVGVVVLGLVIHMFVVYSLALKFAGGYSPVAFFKGVQEAMLMAFSTASSNATLPTALRVADEQLRLPRRVSRFVLTIGATANQNGTALFEGVTVLFLAQFFGVELGVGQQVMVMLVCILGGIGTAGVPSGSMPGVALICAMVGVPPEGIGMVLGVNHFLDMCRTTVNVTGDLGIAAMMSRGESVQAEAAVGGAVLGAVAPE
jgi:DAACS family dicarboxylate/amino acid:cation (Na+ or H+) symporter